MRFKQILRLLNEAPGDTPLEDNGQGGTPVEDETDEPTAQAALNGEVDFGEIPDMDPTAEEPSKFDTKLFYQVADHPYVQREGGHDPSSPDNPVALLAMSKEELTDFANQQKELLAKHQLENRDGVSGTYKDEGGQRIKDLLDFIRVIAEKK